MRLAPAFSAQATAARGASGTRPPMDAVTFLTLFLVLLVAVPANLVFHPLGAFGTPANVLASVGFVCWLCFQLVPNGMPSRGLQPIHVALLFFSAGVLLSYVHGMTRPLVYAELSAADRGLLSLLAWAGITLVAADGICCPDRLRALLRRLVVAAAVLAVVGILQFTVSLDIARYLHVPGLTVNSEATFLQGRSGFNRVAGTASHPIEYGVVLACILPLAFHFAIFDQGRSRLRRWLPVLLVSVGLLMSISRSAMIGAATAGAIMVPTWSKPYRRRILSAAPVFIVAMRLLVPGLIGTILNLFLFINQDTSTQARTQDYSAVYGFIRESPIFGIGFRTYLPSVYGRVLDNQYLSTIVETGFLGLVALLVFFAISTFTARGARRASRDPEHRDLAQCLTAGIVAAALSFATFDALSFPMCVAVLFLLVGCGAALWRMARRSAPGTCHHELSIGTGHGSR